MVMWFTLLNGSPAAPNVQVGALGDVPTPATLKNYSLRSSGSVGSNSVRQTARYTPSFFLFIRKLF